MEDVEDIDCNRYLVSIDALKNYESWNFIVVDPF